jgi:hypothetical protein
VPFFHCSRIIKFLIDTGSTYSAISEKEAGLLGIDCTLLPDYKRGAIGFGGRFKNKMINHPVNLTFKSPTEEHKIMYSSGFRILMIPPQFTGEDREKMLRYTPSVIGMEILKNFRLYLDKRKVELTLAKD